MEVTMSPKTKEELIEVYNTMDAETRKILESSYSTVADTKASESRLEEIKLFCKKVGFKKIGLAFCKGLRAYGEEIDKELSKDFEVYSACCNICKINKSDIKVQQLDPDAAELACNPIGQALTLNDKEVDLAIKCGFCLGHDILFSKYIKSPTTTIMVKDRKHKHNPKAMFEQ